MLKTGKENTGGQSFHRRLLSEYNTEFTLAKYVSYYELKPLVKEIELLRKGIEEKLRKVVLTSGNAAPALPRIPHSSSAQAFVDPFLPLTAKDTLPAGAEEIPDLQEMMERRRRLQDDFFRTLRKSYSKVKTFIMERERDFLESLAELHKKSDTEIRAADPNYIPSLYLQMQSILEYRNLNLLAFRKILKKFLGRCATDSLELQYRLFSVDNVIYNSPIAVSEAINFREEAVSLIAIYGTVFKLSYEDVVQRFNHYCVCSGLNERKILPASEAFFYFENAFPVVRSIEPPLSANKNPEVTPMVGAKKGSFSLRILSGTRSRFIHKMLLEILQCDNNSRKPLVSCGQRANGEVTISLPINVRGEDVFIVQSMVASNQSNANIISAIEEQYQAKKDADVNDSHNSNESGRQQSEIVELGFGDAQTGGNSTSIMELVLLAHTAQISAAKRITAVVPYLAYTKNVASISALAEMLVAAGVNHVITVDMHSEQVEGMFASIPVESITAKYEFVKYLHNLFVREGYHMENLCVVAPTGESLGRAREFADCFMRFGNLDVGRQFVPVCTAVRRVPARMPNKKVVLPRHSSSNSVAGHTSRGVSPTAETVRVFHVTNTKTNINNVNNTNIASPVTPNSSSVPGATGGFPASPFIPVADNSSHGDGGSSRGGTPTMAMEVALKQQTEGRRAIVKTRGLSTSAAPTTLTEDEAAAAAAGKNDGAREEGTHAAPTHASAAASGDRSLPDIIEKRSSKKDIFIVGDVSGKCCIIYDTVIDEAIHICATAVSLRKNGATRIILVATHGVFSGLAVQTLINSPIDLIIMTDSVEQDELLRCTELAKRLRVLPITPLLARAIEKIHSENSLSTLLDNK